MAVNSITYCMVTIITTNMNALKILFIVMFYSHRMSNIPVVRIYLVRTHGFIHYNAYDHSIFRGIRPIFLGGLIESIFS